MTRRSLRHWEIVESQEVFSADPWFRVHRQSIRLPDGRIIRDYHQLELPDCCIIHAQTESGEVVVERQYKHGPRTVGLSLPAGAIDPGEAPLAAAQRELREETGYEAEAWYSLGAFTLNGNYGAGRAHLFCATGARQVQAPASGDLEEMEILTLPLGELRQALIRGEIHLLAAATLILLASDATPGAERK
jgi:ADP-ribose pyrophosphatase